MQRASCLILFEVSAALEDRVLLPLLQLLRDEQLPKYVARTEAVTSHLRASRWLYISKISTSGRPTGAAGSLASSAAAYGCLRECRYAAAIKTTYWGYQRGFPMQR